MCLVTTFESTTSLCDFYPSQNHQISKKIAKFFWKNYQIWAFFFFWKIRQKITNSKTVLFPKMSNGTFSETNFRWKLRKNACFKQKWQHAIAKAQIFAEIPQKMHVYGLREVRTLGSTIFCWNLPKNALHWKTVWIVWNWWEYNILPKSPKYCYDCLLFIF